MDTKWTKEKRAFTFSLPFGSIFVRIRFQFFFRFAFVFFVFFFSPTNHESGGRVLRLPRRRRSIPAAASPRIPPRSSKPSRAFPTTVPVVAAAALATDF
jgi:hypothetical protein